MNGVEDLEKLTKKQLIDKVLALRESVDVRRRDVSKWEERHKTIEKAYNESRQDVEEINSQLKEVITSIDAIINIKFPRLTTFHNHHDFEEVKCDLAENPPTEFENALLYLKALCRFRDRRSNKLGY